MRSITYTFSFLLYFLISLPSHAASVLFEADLKNCGEKKCILLNIEGQKKTFLIDTGGAKHSVSKKFLKSNRNLQHLYHNAYMNSHGNMISNTPLYGKTNHGNEIALKDVYFMDQETFHNSNIQKQHAGDIVPQLLNADYVILDHKNDKLIGLSGDSFEVAKYLSRHYRARFKKFYDYKKGYLNHFYIKTQINDQDDEHYFLLDSGGHNLIWNHIVTNRSSYGTTQISSLSRSSNVRYINPSLKIGYVTFASNPSSMAYKDFNFFQNHMELDNIEIYGSIGMETLEQMIIAIPCKGDYMPMFVAKFNS